MKVKVTKTMCKLLSEKIDKYEFVFEQLSENQYSFYVNCFEENDKDFNPETNKFNVIKVIYPYEYYACPNYLTTKILEKCYHESDKTFNGIIAQVKNYVEI